jgi:hypothetical protein
MTGEDVSVLLERHNPSCGDVVGREEPERRINARQEAAGQGDLVDLGGSRDRSSAVRSDVDGETHARSRLAVYKIPRALCLVARIQRQPDHRWAAPAPDAEPLIRSP